MKRFSAVLTAGLTFALIVNAQQPFLLQDGTPVKLRLNRNLSSADAKVGENVDFEVLEDIAVDGTVVIARGSNAVGTVTQAQPKRRMGRGGKLDVNIDFARLVTGDKVALRAVKETKGGGHAGAMTGGMIATSIVFFPAAPLFLFMHGKDITVPKGTEITAYINADIKLDRSKFAQSGQNEPAAEPVKAASDQKALTNADVLALKGAGLSDDVILAKVKSSPGNYKLDTSDLLDLKKANISDAVIQAMISAKK